MHTGKQTAANQSAALASELWSVMAAEAVQTEIAAVRVEESACLASDGCNLGLHCLRSYEYPRAAYVL